MNWNTEFRIDAVPLDAVRRYYSDHQSWSCTPFNHDEQGIPRAAIFRPRSGQGRHITLPIDRNRVIFAYSLTTGLWPALSLDVPPSNEWAAPGARHIYCPGLDRWLCKRAVRNPDDVQWGIKDDATWLTVETAALAADVLEVIGYKVEVRTVRPLWGLLAKLPEEPLLVAA